MYVFTEKLYTFACHFNYRPDHCMYMSNCKSAEDKGISVVHGSRSSYHNDKQPAFKAVYQALRDVSTPSPNGNLCFISCNATSQKQGSETKRIASRIAACIDLKYRGLAHKSECIQFIFIIMCYRHRIYI